MFDDAPVLATVRSVVASRPSEGFLKVNPGSCFQEFDMLKLRYMYQIPAVVKIRAPHSHERVDWDVQDGGASISLPLKQVSDFQFLDL